MAISSILIGVSLSMVQDVIYALPDRACLFSVYTSGGTIAVSVDGTNYQNITLDSNKNFQTSGLLIKSTGAASVIIAKLQ